MLDFVFILLIFFEIVVTIFCIVKLQALENKLQTINEKIKAYGEKIPKILEKTREIVKKINKVTNVLTSRKFLLTVQAIKNIFDTIQIIFLIYTIRNPKKCMGKSYIKAKKLMLVEIILRLIKKYISSLKIPTEI